MTNKNDITGDVIVSKISKSYSDNFDSIFRPRADFAKCAGQSEIATNICAYRTGCDRYLRPTAEKQYWMDFWKAEDDCPQYVSITIA